MKCRLRGDAGETLLIGYGDDEREAISDLYDSLIGALTTISLCGSLEVAREAARLVKAELDRYEVET